MANEWHQTGSISQKGASGSVETAIARLSRHRVVLRSVLHRIGLSDEQIRHRVRSGRLVRLHPGVYAVGPAQLDDAGRFRAAVLAGGEGALLAGRAACVWWGVVVGSPAELDVAVTTHRRNRPGVRFRRTARGSDEATVRDGIPIVCPARAILDLAAEVSGRPLERALNEARVARLPMRPDLAELIERYPGRPGVRAAREAQAMFAAGPTPTRSWMEERLLAIIDRRGLPRPLTNLPIATEAGTLVVDCAWPPRRVVIEIDAWGTHSSRRSMIEDRRRDRALRIAGRHPSRVIWEDFGDEQRLGDEIAKLLRSPTAHPAA
jgi:hypothetical protein